MAPEDGGEESHRPPPHPLDRIWVHPSELAATGRNPPRRGRWLAVVATATVTGLAVGTGLLVFAGLLAGDSQEVGRSVADGLTVDDALTAAVVLVSAAQPPDATSGSGISLGNGQVVTSAQLVGDGAAITVTDSDGEAHGASLVGRDEANDLALLEVDATLPSAPLGRSDLLAEDARVVAIAATVDDPHWVRAARLRERDALAESAAGDVLYAGLLDTELPTTVLHAGGALVNSDGMVVGILTAPPGTALTGAAIPIEKVTGVCDQLRRTGYADHGWFGVIAHDAYPGVRISALVENGPADEAGLRVGDVVVGVGDSDVESKGELAAEVRARRPGDVVELRITRNGRHEGLDITLGQLDPSSQATP